MTKSSGIVPPPPPHQSPTSPPPAPPEEIFDIHEKSPNSGTTEDPPSDRDSSIDHRPSTSISCTRPNVGSLVQLDYNPEPLDNWFPQELLNGGLCSHGSTWSLPMNPLQESPMAETAGLDTVKEDVSPGSSTFQVRLQHVRHSKISL